MTEPVDVLAIGAHPDDVEVGCGGVLLLALDAGLRVSVADLTAGERATRGTPERRAEERDRASELLGLAARLGVGIPDGTLGQDPGHRAAVIRLIRAIRPTIVLAPYPLDRHPDHAAAGDLVRQASFLAGVGRMEEDAGSPHRPDRLYHYMIHHPFTPSFVVDVSAVWDRKMAVVAAYESQFGHLPASPGTDLDRGSFLRVVEARATLHGAMIGVERGEAFHCRGPVPLGFLPGIHDIGMPGPGYGMFH
jgi:bacillithiol biosynthesis deacetylase BshB1